MVKCTFLPNAVPEYLETEAARATIRDVSEVLIEQAECELKDWWKLFRPFRWPCLEMWRTHFDLGGQSGLLYASFLVGNKPDAIMFSVEEANFEDYEWPPDTRGNAMSLVAIYSKRNRHLGARIVVIHRDGRVVEIADYGMEPTNSENRDLRATLEKDARRYIKKF